MSTLQRITNIRLIVGLLLLCVFPADLYIVLASQDNFWKHLELVGTIVNEPQGKSIAIIEDLREHHQGIYSIGIKVPGGAEVLNIMAKSVLLEKDGSYYELKLRFSLDKAGYYETAYQRLSPNEWRINASQIFSSLWDAAKFFNGIRVANFKCPDGVEGLRLNEIPDEHLLKNIGFEEGDIVEEINGQRVDNVGDVIDYLWKLDNQSNVVVSLDRQGDKRKLTYHNTSKDIPPYSSRQIKQAAQNSGLMGVAVNASW